MYDKSDTKQSKAANKSEERESGKVSKAIAGNASGKIQQQGRISIAYGNIIF